jgi:hypothetical protein
LGHADIQPRWCANIVFYTHKLSIVPFSRSTIAEMTRRNMPRG